MKGILIRNGDDEDLRLRAKRFSLKVAVDDGWKLPFDRTLVVEAGTRVPWDLLPAAWHFLERWDAAVPLWRYGATAEDVGTAQERKATKAITRDLRLLLYSYELLFVNGASAAGSDLFRCWGDECQKGADKRLAFLRAIYLVKPRLCVLPTTWLANVRQWSDRHPQYRRQMSGKILKPLVTVEITPGQMVKVHAGDEEKVLAMMQMQDPRSQNMSVINQESFVLDSQKTRSKKGPLVRVELQPGRFVKMYEADAIAEGHIKPKAAPPQENKSRPSQQDKARPPAEDKEAAETAVPESGETAVSEPPAAEKTDDLATIAGVGPATVRMLAAHGIDSFAALRQADLSFLSSQARLAIERWRHNG